MVFCPIAPGDFQSNRKAEIVKQAQAPHEFVRVPEGGLVLRSAERSTAGPGVAVDLLSAPALI